MSWPTAASGRAEMAVAAARAPVAVLVAGVIGVLAMTVPIVGLAVRAPWPRLPMIATSPATLGALGLSLLTSTVATAVAVVLGLPLAQLLARPGWRPAGVVRALITVPLVLPPVVAGVALFAALGRTGVIGGPIHTLTGLALPFTTPAVVVAQLFVAMPFLVLSVEGALRSTDQRFGDAARTLGARPWQVWWLVVLPLVRPAIVSGAVLAWARAFGEFGATITFAGNFPGTTQTLPLQVYADLQTDPERAIGVAMIMFAVTVLILVLVRQRRAPVW